MLDTLFKSALSFFRGELFKDNHRVVAKIAIGGTLVLAILLVSNLLVGFWVSSLLAGLAGGFAQPLLFKDLRYR